MVSPIPWILVFIVTIFCPRVLAVDRVVDWNVAWMTACPDGVCREVIGINGRWPPQAVWINKYDKLILRVRNFLNDGECITVHTHGIDEPMANFYDGVDFVTQWYRQS